MTPGERVARAQRASELWNAFDGLLNDVRDKLVKSLESSALGDVDTHHNTAISLQLLTVIRSELRRQIDDGKMATAEQEQESWIRRMRRRG